MNNNKKTVSDFIFEISFDNGYFFKYLIDFVSVCVPEQDKLCEFIFNENGIYLTYKSEKTDNIKYFVFLDLERSNFIKYKINKNLKIFLEPKQLQKICRNIKKKDKVVLKFTNQKKLLLIINTEDIYSMEETKEIIYSRYYEINITDDKELEKPTGSSGNPFSLSSNNIQNLRKAVGVKTEPVLMYLQDEYLEFITVSHRISPLTIKYGKYDENKPKNKVSLSGSIISILSKLSNLSNKIKFFPNEDDDSSVGWIKVSANIDIPQYMGNVDIFVVHNK